MVRATLQGSGPPPATPDDQRHSSRRVMAFERWLARSLLRAVGDPPVSVVFWNGEVLETARRAPISKLHIRDHRGLLSLAADPYFAFGDLYASGRIEIEGDLVETLEAILFSLAETPRPSRSDEPATRLIHRSNRNSSVDSRRNVHRHYDLGNDFYALWLDKEAMQYTCAYFPEPQMTLEQAQRAKMHHVCRKLQLRPGDRVVEAGCGWGGFACFMAREYGARVRAYNISSQQIAYARELARQRGLEHMVDFVDGDYRTIDGAYDVFASVGMLEHVGPDHYDELGAVIDRCLTPNGRGLIHTIGRNRPGPMNPWIEKRIFPGARPPSLAEMMQVLEPREFSVLDVENLRLHYAKTLEHWLQRFQAQERKVRLLLGKRFVRTWRFYLASSKAAFTASSLQLFQVVFARPRKNDLPWSRAHLYRP